MKSATKQNLVMQLPNLDTRNSKNQVLEDFIPPTDQVYATSHLYSFIIAALYKIQKQCRACNLPIITRGALVYETRL